ncbi:ribonuclease H-like domain-containing protein [Mycena sp. CBHHK59/15]|nr:ribonuclease H-like domain-containing protein [Mycena sp. CBHHK59/15]
MADLNPLWDFFHRGVKQNQAHWKTYCKGCVKKHMEDAGSPMTDIITRGQSYLDGTARFIKIFHHSFYPACTAVGHVISVKSSWIAHILGGKTACPNASVEAKAEATAQRKETSDAKELKKHPRSATPDPTEPLPKKHQTHMFRSTAPEVMPTGKVIGGRLLNEAAEEVEVWIENTLKDKDAGMSTDGWKCKKKDSVNAICANVDYKSHLLKLVEVTSLNKDGTSQCELFEDMIDRTEKKFGCKIRYFTTDSDGGSKKGRINLGTYRCHFDIWKSTDVEQFQLILGDYFKVNDMAAAIAEDATGLIAWLNNHGNVRKIFDTSQKIVSMQNLGRYIILAYLIANLTRWTTHDVAFARLFFLKEPLQFAVYTRRKDIIEAQVGAAVSTEGERLRVDAEKYCALIKDEAFWHGLETVLSDLEPICLGTNINQKDSTRPDQVSLTIAGIFLHFSDHPEPEVKSLMLVRLEKRWKDCDQPVFLAALILNLFEMMTCFGPNANLNQIKCLNMVVLLYHRVMSRPDNTDTAADRKVKEGQVSKAFVQYLSGSGDFCDFNAKEWEEIHESTDPVMVWEALAGSSHITELAQFAIIILQIVVNQAGCERTFSQTKIEQSDHRVRLGLDKIEKRTKIRAEIRAEHIEKGLYKPRKPRKNHKSTATLLSVPRYRDLLGDQDDEDPTERGRALVSSVVGWRTQMAKWIGDARAAEREETEEDSEDEETPLLPNRPTTWKSLTLQVLFGGAEPRKRKPEPRAMAEEEILMEELANAAEDEILDDGAVEIDSDDEYRA